MNNRLLWAVAGACLGMGGCGGDASASKGAEGAKLTTTVKPEDWSCNPKTNAGQCKPIELQSALPVGTDYEISHLAAGASFRIETDSSGNYSLAFLSAEWAAALLKATITWVPAQSEALPDDKCPAPPPAPPTKPAAGATKAKFQVPDLNLYARFESSEVWIHNSDTQFSQPERNVLYIFPIAGSSYDYCLMFGIYGAAGGGLHDGAVHGDS